MKMGTQSTTLMSVLMVKADVRIEEIEMKVVNDFLYYMVEENAHILRVKKVYDAYKKNKTGDFYVDVHTYNQAFASLKKITTEKRRELEI